MSAIWLLAVLLLAPLGAKGTATEARESQDVALTNALIEALGDASMHAVRANDPAEACPARCLQVAVHRADPTRFIVDVRVHAARRRITVRLDPAAPRFDQIHALAIEVELLAERARARKPRPAPTALANSATGGAAVGAKVEAADDAEEPPAETRTGKPDDQPASALAAQPPVAPPSGPSPTVETIQHTPVAAPRPADLALNVAATVLAGTSGDLFMHGFSIGLRLRFTDRIDARLGAALLKPQNDHQGGVSFHREIMPLHLLVESETPRVPNLHVGLGVEAFVIEGEQNDRSVSNFLSVGAVGRIEYRYAIRSFALLSSLQAGFHPDAWSNVKEGSGPLFEFSRWTLSAALGLEFNIL
jgi:hypothetical protein